MYIFKTMVYGGTIYFMEKLNILGTGHAMTLDCYNTCFTIENNEGEHILVDKG